MANVAKCPGCGSFYNGSMYSACPYCGKEAEVLDAPAKPQEVKPSGWCGFFGRIGKKPNHQDASEPDKISEADSSSAIPEDVPTTVPAIIPESMAETIMDQSSINAESSISQMGLEHEGSAATAPASQGETDSLIVQLGGMGRTIGKYISSSGETVSPVVGWIIGVKGPSFGKSFPLKSGRNRIGRSGEMDVPLLDDESVSRTCVGEIIYDSRANAYSMLPGTSDSLTYLNGNALYERTVLSGFEEIEFGDSGRNKYVFVPLCGDSFQWARYTQE